MKRFQTIGRWRGARVAVLYGGFGGEREISLRSGQAVLEVLRARGYDAVGVDADQTLGPVLTELKPAVVFLAFHGRYGEDGAVQGMLEWMGIPYTGAGVAASAVAMNKVMTKRVWRAEGLPTPAFCTLDRATLSEWKDPQAPPRPLEALSFPVFVKPVSQGSSLASCRVEHLGDLRTACCAAAEAEGGRGGEGWRLRESLDLEEQCSPSNGVPLVLVEAFETGRELSVAILRDQPLGIVEIRTAKGMYDYEAKYVAQTTRYLTPAPLEPAAAAEVAQLALRAARLLQLGAFARIDGILGERGLSLLEANSLPGMLRSSLYPSIARSVGIGYEELCELLLDDACLKLTAN